MRPWLLCLLVGCASAQQPPPKSHVERAHPVQVGDRIPDATAGKVTLVVFWATWSEPSKKMLVALEGVWQRKQARGLVIKAVCIDDEASYISEFQKTYGLTFPIEWDAEHRMATRYALPTSEAVYVVDRSGVVRFVHSGYHHDEDERIEAHVDSLL